LGQLIGALIGELAQLVRFEVSNANTGFSLIAVKLELIRLSWVHNSYHLLKSLGSGTVISL